MHLYEWLTIVALIVGPIAAVQIQKELERFRDARERKVRIFKALMATRAASLAPDHVTALNLIDLEFQGKDYSEVTTAWKTYLDHLNSYPNDEKQQAIWITRRIDLLAVLLLAMGKSLGYNFDEVYVKKGIYAPVGHGRVEDEQTLLRRGLVRLLLGETTLKMDVASFPTNPEAKESQKVFTEALHRLAGRIEQVEKQQEPSATTSGKRG